MKRNMHVENRGMQKALQQSSQVYDFLSYVDVIIVNKKQNIVTSLSGLPLLKQQSFLFATKNFC